MASRGQAENVGEGLLLTARRCAASSRKRLETSSDATGDFERFRSNRTVALGFPVHYDEAMGTTLAEMRSTYAAALDRALGTAVRTLAELPEVEKVIVFGSYQRGRRDLFTDLDLLVIVRSSESFISRMERLYRLLGGKMEVDFDLVAYSPEEVAENASHPFLKRALEEGEVVYEKPG